MNRIALIAPALIAVCFVQPQQAMAQWTRHSIDASSRGADGVRIADANGDGLPDIVTGWEEGGRIRICLHPGNAKSKETWPAVTVGKVKSPEDALFCDLDDDGSMDVVSCCEGKTKSVFFHWAPKAKEQFLEAGNWKTQAVDATRDRQAWMFAIAMDVDGKHGIDIVLGAKGENATVGWLESPENPRDIENWKFHSLYQAGWIMSIVESDVDLDGDPDILISDRKGGNRGIKWLENPGKTAINAHANWNERKIDGPDREVMFVDLQDVDMDGADDLIVATRNSEIDFYFRQGKTVSWQHHAIENPFGVPHGKAVAAGDIDLDGRIDLVHSSNKGGKRQTPGIAWLRYETSPRDEKWNATDISGEGGVKFDLVELLDLDGDGDLDVLTCEERDNLGVFWYENPLRGDDSQLRR